MSRPAPDDPDEARGVTAPLRVLVVDDEPLARDCVRLAIAGEPDVEVVGECANGLEAVEAIQGLSPDLVFLDVQMPELDGFEVVEACAPHGLPAVIFVTAYDQYALKAFEAHALDYLLKPVDGVRFHAALDRAREQIARLADRDVNARIAVLLEELRRDRSYAERIVVRGRERILLVDVSEIDRIEAAENYVEIHAGRQTHLVRDTMQNMEAKLDPRRFLRIRRSTIVNVARVKELRPLFNGEYAVLLSDGTELTSSRRFRKNLDSLLDS
jgi:two-component system LytT family response regulator